MTEPKTTFAGGVVPSWATVPGEAPKKPVVIGPRQRKIMVKESNRSRVLNMIASGARLTAPEIAARLELTEKQVREAACHLMSARLIHSAHVYCPVRKGRGQ